MIKTLLTGAAMALALSSPVLAQDDAPDVTPAQAQVRERMAVALMDICLPATNGADLASSPILTALGSPSVSTPDYDPEVRELVTDDGVHVTRYTSSACGVQYFRPEDLPIPDDEGVGDALNAVLDLIDTPGSGWTRNEPDGLGYPPFNSSDFRHWIEIDIQRDSAVVHRYLNPPEVVRAFFEATARADARSGPQAVIEAVDTCAAFVRAVTREPEDSEAYELESELAPLDGLTRFLGGPNPKLRGDLDSWLTLDGTECTLEVMASQDGDRYLDRFKADVVARLTVAGSGWTAASEGAWTRTDGARLALGERGDDRQTWIVIPAS